MSRFTSSTGNLAPSSGTGGVTLLRAQLDSRAMDKFVIEGGYPLSGTVVPAGNKNAALPIIAASLLTDEEVVIGNVPRIRDVDYMLALLEDLGVSVLWRDDHELSLRADSLRSSEVDLVGQKLEVSEVPHATPSTRRRTASFSQPA